MVVRPDLLVCTIGALPTPTVLGAKKQGDGTFVVERPKLEALGVYLSEIQKWISEAKVCLETGARIPAAVSGSGGGGVGAYDDPRTH